ncbi:hypothetical protein Acsp03_02960 [Actinomadura sp. NBRC 104412]|uniref:hypothetical protein n=1 Tax=Actinomadura sp. NBRC 104412 TaxID=3032203 RepID=UPI0024A55001|nr:hypothetical protein [Actinomadura sp. NBRC 104412]GLZ02829.1 hypothetical protein Acsp03_02960 [Actinomadura sp. NBRC 104412]
MSLFPRARERARGSARGSALRSAVAGVALVSALVAGGTAYAAPVPSPSKDWTIEAFQGGGHRVTLRLDEPLPVRDAAPELQVPVRGDTVAADGPQSYQVVASVPVNAVIGAGFARLVVIDDDQAA